MPQTSICSFSNFYRPETLSQEYDGHAVSPGMNPYLHMLVSTNWLSPAEQASY